MTITGGGGIALGPSAFGVAGLSADFGLVVCNGLRVASSALVRALLGLVLTNP